MRNAFYVQTHALSLRAPEDGLGEETGCILSEVGSTTGTDIKMKLPWFLQPSSGP